MGKKQRRQVEEESCFLKIPAIPGYRSKLGHAIPDWPATFQQQLHTTERESQKCGCQYAAYATFSTESMYVVKCVGFGIREVKMEATWKDGELFEEGIGEWGKR